MKITTLPLKNSMNRSPLRLGFLLNALALGVAWLAPWQLANAQCPQICDSSSLNTAFGVNALPGDTGNFNTAIGFNAIFSNTSGNDNTATGFQALQNNTTGHDNTANGLQALQSNTSGIENTAVGVNALMFNTIGSFNIAVGSGALEMNTSGNLNTAIGDLALVSNTTGTQNTANGDFALFSNTTGGDNTAIGASALNFNTIGSNNTALGDDALRVTTGSYNIGLGFKAGTNLTSGSRNIDIGSDGVAGESNTIRIGRVVDQSATFMAGISGATVPTGVAVIVDSSGHLGTTTSSARFKEAIKPMDKASEAILALKPVTFRYKPELDPDGIQQFGLVAEDVEKVNPDLVARDADGKPYTVRYEAVNAMLLNEFLKARRQIDAQQKQIDALTAGLQKVSARLELNKCAPQKIVSNQ